MTTPTRMGLILGSAGILAALLSVSSNRSETAQLNESNVGVPKAISYTPGQRVLLVFIGSEDCAFSRAPGFDQTVDSIRTLVFAQARGKGMRFSTLGISTGASVDAGATYLRRFGPFDEVAIGHGLTNTAAMRYLWESFPAQPAFPQIVVLQRELVALEPGFAFENEEVIVRLVGVPQIERWLADKAPIY